LCFQQFTPYHRLQIVSILVQFDMNDVLKPIPLRFWRSVSGREPVREWLSEMPPDDKRIIGRDMAKVQFGWPVGLPLCRPMSGGLWEVRSSLPSGREARVLFGFYKGTFYALHGFIKKSQKTPEHELELAQQRYRDLTHDR
jgi:phage-related protein